MAFAPRTAAQYEADGAHPAAAAQQAQLDAWLASHGIQKVTAQAIQDAITDDYLDALAADGFLTSGTGRAAAVADCWACMSEDHRPHLRGQLLHDPDCPNRQRGAIRRAPAYATAN